MKKFLILGNLNSVVYKDIFPLFVNNAFRFGVSKNATNSIFRVNEDYCGKYTFYDKGVKYAKVCNVCWFTNIGEQRYVKPLNLKKQYSSEEYTMFDEYPAINVDRIKDIPYDYEGIIGVPITYLIKHNNRQFEIVGKAMHGNSTQCLDLFVPYINDKKKYIRILIRKKINK
jgi:hypothetical protein